mgnify:CR=1 FL=1
MLDLIDDMRLHAIARFDRFQELAKLNAVSQQERDDAYAALKQAEVSSDTPSVQGYILAKSANRFMHQAKELPSVSPMGSVR